MLPFNFDFISASKVALYFKGICAYAAFEYFMISGYPIWVIIVTGAIFVVCLGMTLPIYFNLGGEIIFPIGEAHSQGYSND